MCSELLTHTYSTSQHHNQHLPSLSSSAESVIVRVRSLISPPGLLAVWLWLQLFTDRILGAVSDFHLMFSSRWRWHTFLCWQNEPFVCVCVRWPATLAENKAWVVSWANEWPIQWSGVHGLRHSLYPSVLLSSFLLFIKWMQSADLKA